jgi:hypothetical protein
LTEIEHVPPAAMEPPVTPIELPPAAPPVTEPPQVLATAGVAVLVSVEVHALPATFAGYVSVNCRPVSAVVALGLKTVIVMRDTSPAPVVLGENVFVMPAAT